MFCGCVWLCQKGLEEIELARNRIVKMSSCWLPHLQVFCFAILFLYSQRRKHAFLLFLINQLKQTYCKCSDYHFKNSTGYLTRNILHISFTSLLDPVYCSFIDPSFYHSSFSPKRCQSLSSPWCICFLHQVLLQFCTPIIVKHLAVNPANHVRQQCNKQGYQEFSVWTHLSIQKDVRAFLPHAEKGQSSKGYSLLQLCMSACQHPSQDKPCLQVTLVT